MSQRSERTSGDEPLLDDQPLLDDDGPVVEGELDVGPQIAEEHGDGDDEAIVVGSDDEAIVLDEPDGADDDGSPAPETSENDELADVIGTEIHELTTERDQFKDTAQRLAADFDNYRKRMSTQLANEVDRATGQLASALLPVLDATESAYLQHPDEVGPLLNLMLAELKKHGLEPIHLLDQPFDPNLADAVAHEPGEGGEPVVAEVLRSGYLWNGRTLRPAMVRTRD